MQQLHTTNRTPGIAATQMAGETSNLAPHLLSLEAGEWAMWKESVLRSTGFPAVEVLKLATPEFAAAVDRYLEAERELKAAKSVVVSCVNAVCDALKREDLWKDKTRRAPLRAISQCLKARRRVESPNATGELAVALANYNQSLTRVESLLDSQAHEFQIAQLRVSHALREVASSPRFHEAVIWQNHAAWNRGIKNQLLESINPSKRPHSQRQHEELIAMYLQRYCMKNDTIGFFGPVGWAQFVPEGEAIEVRPGPELLAARNVYIESWCMDEVAETIGREPSLRPWLAPRRMPFVGLVDGTLTLPGGASLKLTAKEAAILAACDGQRTAKELAATLIEGRGGVKNEAEVYECLDTYCKRGLLVWKLEVPVSQWGIERLRALLEGIGDERVRREALAKLDKFEAGRRRIIAAAGDPEQLDAALSAFEEEFGRFTGVAPNRAAGQVYGARTLIYEDCRRDLEAKIGPTVLEALAPPLSLLLRSGRWLSYEVAALYRAALRPVYEELVQKTGSRVVSAVDFWIKCDRFFFKEDTRLAENILPQFQQRWAEVLQLPPEARRVKFTYEQLRSRIERAFAAPRPGWSYARYQSPDVMIAASSVEAIRRNDFQLTIGEVHLGINWIGCTSFVAQHPRMEELHEAITSDFARPRLVPVIPKNWTGVTTRTYFEFVSPRNFRLLISPDSYGGEPSRTVPISDLVVEERDGQLLLRTIDERWQFEIIDSFGEFLSNLIVDLFQPLPRQRHTPRITIDRLTIAREAWRFGAAELSFAFEKDEVQRFVGARRWKHEFDLPRFVFIKAPVERKPLYLDLESPTLINIFATIIRRTKEANAPDLAISVTEMYPAHDQLWLPDAEGNLYTNEFRLAALDLSDEW